MRARGFTLVEVLVAVAVLAIAMSAVIGAMARQADNAGYLRQKSIALWVAHNRLAELQLQKEIPSTGRSDGRMEMAGVEWTWQAEVKTTEDERLLRIDIRVLGPAPIRGAGSLAGSSREAPSLAQLSGFIAVPK